MAAGSSGDSSSMTIDGRSAVCTGDAIGELTKFSICGGSGAMSTATTAVGIDSSGAMTSGATRLGCGVIFAASMAVRVLNCSGSGWGTLVGAARGNDDNGCTGFAPTANSYSSSTNSTRASACDGGGAGATGGMAISAFSMAARVSTPSGVGVVADMCLSYEAIILPLVAMTLSSIWIA
ncbi:unnamed protein product [Linum trigynum]|uniref:Uncharacterized protein n=1 Tax=Linum trigynum TaxID=586398 RepID=A0AAV2FRQ1_9ROSI